MVTLPSIRRISQCGFEGESFTQAGANRLAEQVTQGWLQVVKYSSRTLFVTRILKSAQQPQNGLPVLIGA